MSVGQGQWGRGGDGIQVRSGWGVEDQGHGWEWGQVKGWGLWLGLGWGLGSGGWGRHGIQVQSGLGLKVMDRVGNGVRLRVGGCGCDVGVVRIQARSGLGVGE